MSQGSATRQTSESWRQARSGQALGMAGASRVCGLAYLLACGPLACGSNEQPNPPATSAGSGGGPFAVGGVQSGGAVAVGAGGGAGTGAGAVGGSATQGGSASVGGSATMGGSAAAVGGAATGGMGMGGAGMSVQGPPPELGLSPLVAGFTRPVFIAQPPGETERLFVVEQPGSIETVELSGATATRLAEPFLDISDIVLDFGNERGLLGLAFHPQFQENGLFYLDYTTATREGRRSGSTVVSEWRLLEGDSNRADPESERVLVVVEQPESNHNGGSLAFGPDGYLYIGLGDGGGSGDAHGLRGNGQNLQTLLGKILRLDVDGREVNSAYSIPSGNYAEATDSEALPEIWSVGWRNPWRFSFDRATGDLYVADVGQNAREEVSFEPAGSSGRNYGWRLMEGERCFSPGVGCNAGTQGLTLPIASYGRSLGQSITGGYVYRGAAMPGLVGYYLYADYVSGQFWWLKQGQDGTLLQEATRITDDINPGRAVREIASFGEDASGELYVVSFRGGNIYRIVAD